MINNRGSKHGIDYAYGGWYRNVAIENIPHVVLKTLQKKKKEFTRVK